MAQRYMEGMGKEKLHFSLLELAKCQKGPLGKSVSTYFVTNHCFNKQDISRQIFHLTFM